MKIIGWIREGDRAACGAMVIEGAPTCRSHRRAHAFVGARMACPKNCVIAQWFVRSTLTNGRVQVIHGMKTSGGCPCLSTLNDIDGVGNSGDEQIHLTTPQIEGVPYYAETADGCRFFGRIEVEGLLPRIATDDEDEYAVYWGDEALAKMQKAAS